MMKRKLVALVLALCMVFSLVPMGAFAASRDAATATVTVDSEHSSIWSEAVVANTETEGTVSITVDLEKLNTKADTAKELLNTANNGIFNTDDTTFPDRPLTQLCLPITITAANITPATVTCVRMSDDTNMDQGTTTGGAGPNTSVSATYSGDKMSVSEWPVVACADLKKDTEDETKWTWKNTPAFAFNDVGATGQLTTWKYVVTWKSSEGAELLKKEVVINLTKKPLAPEFLPADATNTFQTKKAADVQTGTPVFTKTNDNKIAVSGVTLKYIKWPEFNGSYATEQSGYYLAFSVPRSVEGTEIKTMKIPGHTADGEAVDKTINADSFTEKNNTQCDLFVWLGNTEYAAKTKTYAIKTTYGENGTETTSTLDFSGLKFEDVVTITPGTQADKDGTVTGPLSTGYTATAGAADGDGKIPVAVTASSIKEHKAGNDKMGWWVGATFTPNVPDKVNADDYVILYKDPSTNKWAIDTDSCTDGSIASMYVDAFPKDETTFATREIIVGVFKKSVVFNDGAVKRDLVDDAATMVRTYKVTASSCSKYTPAPPVTVPTTKPDPTEESTPTPTPSTEPSPSPSTEPTTDPTTSPTTDPTTSPTTDPTTSPTTNPTPTPKPVVEVTPDVKVDEETGAVSAEVPAEKTEEIIEAAKKEDNATVTVKVDAPADSDKPVNEATVSLPAQTVEQLGKDTTADLKVETPVASVTVSQNDLATLGSGAENVTVSVKKDTEAGTVQVEVKKDDKAVEDIALKAEVPSIDDSKLTPTTVAVIVDANGKETIVPKSVVNSDNSAITVLLQSGNATIKLKENKKEFTDAIPSWAEDHVDFVTSRGLYGGTAEGVFNPNASMNRAMLVQVLYALESRPQTDTNDLFGDVPEGQWYTKAVAWGKATGIVAGVSPTEFGPNNKVTREQLALILYNFAKKSGMDTSKSASTDSFNDAGQVHSWADKALQWAVGNNIIAGKDGNKLDPRGNATRAQVAVMITNFVKLMTK